MILQNPLVLTFFFYKFQHFFYVNHDCGNSAIILTSNKTKHKKTNKKKFSVGEQGIPQWVCSGETLRFCWETSSLLQLHHSPGGPTELLSIQWGTSTSSRSSSSQTKSILKHHSLWFPHYFTCQTVTKQPEIPENKTRGTTPYFLLGPNLRLDNVIVHF